MPLASPPVTVPRQRSRLCPVQASRSNPLLFQAQTVHPAALRPSQTCVQILDAPPTSIRDRHCRGLQVPHARNSTPNVTHQPWFRKLVGAEVPRTDGRGQTSGPALPWALPIKACRRHRPGQRLHVLEMIRGD